MSLARNAVARPVTTLMFACGGVLLGLAGLSGLSVDLLPPLQIPSLIVQTTHPGMGASELDRTVAGPIEAVIGTVRGARKIRSVSREGFVVVKAEFSWGIDMNYALLEARDKLDQIRSGLPPGTTRPVVLPFDPAIDPVMIIGVLRRPESPQDGGMSSGGASALADLKETARQYVQPRLEQVDGVAQVSLIGGAEREIRVRLDSRALASANLTQDDVLRSLAAANVSLPAGAVREGLARYPLRTLGEFSSLDDIRNTMAGKTVSGRAVLLHEVATVSDAFKERSGLARLNGSELIAIEVRKQPGENTVTLSRRLHTVMEKLRAEHAGISLEVLRDEAEDITRSVADVEGAILAGGALAFLVLFAFLGNWRAPFIIALAMPLSLLATVAAMYFLNINLNVISLSGLALGIGMLGDNAIIVIENASRLRDSGMGARESAITGAGEINLAATASTLTNVAVFLPLVLIDGPAQRLFAQMGITMTFSLLISLLVGVTVVPALLARGPERRTEPAWQRVVSERMGQITARWTEMLLDRRKHVLGLTVILLGLTLAAAGWIPVETATDINQQRAWLRLRLPPDATCEQTSGAAASFEAQLLGIQGVKRTFSLVGLSEGRDLWSLEDAAVQHALIEVTFDEGDVARGAVGKIRKLAADISASVPGTDCAFGRMPTFLERLLAAGTSQVEITIAGADPAVRERLLGTVSEKLASVHGLTSLHQPGGGRTAHEGLLIDPERAGINGLTPDEIAGHIIAGEEGKEATSLNEFDRQTPVIVSLRGECLVPIPGRPGSMVPARTLVHRQIMASSAEVRREDRRQVSLLRGSVEGRAVSAVANEARQLCCDIPVPTGYAITVGGQDEETRASISSLVMVALLSLILVYMILAAEYESVIYPLVILLTSPLALIGALAAMVCTGLPYNVMSLVGIVIMIGAVDNDAVIAVDLITALRRSGVPLHDAVREGLKRRIRPILMTTATTVLGIIPLVLLSGEGSAMVKALTVPILGGLLSSTVFTVTVIPVVYTYVDRWAWRTRWPGMR